MNTFEDQKKIIEDMKLNFDRLMQIQAQALDQIPAEMLPIKNEVQKDLGKIMKLVQKNDLNALQNLAKKYASHNTK